MSKDEDGDGATKVYEVRVDEIRCYPMVYKIEAESEDDAREQIDLGNILDKWQDGNSEITSWEIFEVCMVEGVEEE